MDALNWRLALAILAGCALLPATTAAQDEKERRPDRLLRLLPLGEAPPFKFEIVNGARVEREPPPGSIPPRQVQVGDEEGQEAGPPLRLVLDRLSASIPVPVGRVPLHESGEDGFESMPWHIVTVPAKASHALALLWRDPAEEKWTKAKSLTLADDVASFPAGMVRLVNVSPWPVGIKFGGKNILLPAGRQVLQGQPRQVLRQAPVVVSLEDRSGTWRPMFHQAINQAAGERTNIIVYKADGESPRRPVRVRVLSERAVLPEPPKLAD